MQAGYLNIGLTGTDMSGSFYLPKIIGFARANEVLMTARRIGAEELYDWGFANRLVADEDVVDTALELAEVMVKNTSPFGLRLTKESMQSSVVAIASIRRSRWKIAIKWWQRKRKMRTAERAR